MKYLIIGGAGFIGSNLVDELINQGNEVVVIDNLLNCSKKNINKKAKFFELDICSKKVLSVFKKEKPEVVFYLAGPINFRREVSDPVFEKSLSIFDGFYKVAEYASVAKVKKFIFVSSGGAVYSEAQIIPTKEDYLCHPDSLYGIANLFLEKLLQEISKKNNLNYSILRMANVYGPRQWENGVVPSFIKNTLVKKEVVINGDGTQTRDFLYISDAVSALLAGVLSKGGEIFNIGSGQEISLNDLAKKISNILKVKLEIKYNFSEEKTQRSCLDISYAKKELNWHPKVNLESGLAKTINYYNGK